MDERDLALRNHVYRRFVELGRAPTLSEIAGELGLSPTEAEAGLRRLHDAHALVLERDRPEIRMANPFSAVPTPHRVEAAGRSWHANCAWDAFGIPAAEMLRTASGTRPRSRRVALPSSLRPFSS